jgi:IS5 family transposase
LRAIIKLGKQALKHKIKLRRSYSRVAQMAQQASGYASSHQYSRLNKSNRTMKNLLGRLLRDIERKSSDKVFSTNFLTLIGLSQELLVQEKNSKNKIYSLHEPDVQCISKGKARIRYEFGNKVSVVTTNTRWIVNVQDCPGNPDGNTLKELLSWAEKITQVPIEEATVDKGYRGHNYEGEAVIRIAGSSNAGLSFSKRKRKRRRSAVEPIIGHLKVGHRLGRCFLRGLVGDALNVIGSVIGFNVRKLLNLIANKKRSHTPTKITNITLPKITLKQIWENFAKTYHNFTTKKSQHSKILN